MKKWLFLFILLAGLLYKPETVERAITLAIPKVKAMGYAIAGYLEVEASEVDGIFQSDLVVAMTDEENIETAVFAAHEAVSEMKEYIASVIESD